MRDWVGGGTDTDVLPTQDSNSEIWDEVQLASAWAVSKHLGKNIKVAVIDSGLDTTHPLFAKRLVSAKEWWDFVGNDSDPQEEGNPEDAGYGHGTGMAGVIVQVAPLVKIMPLRVLQANGQGDEINVLKAIDWAISKHADIINLSLGSYAVSTAVDTMLDVATKKGIVVIASAGNDGQEQSTFPASKALSNTNVLSVASNGFVKESLKATSKFKSNFSNYGPSISVAAPGEHIFTAFPMQQGRAWSGTSVSAAITSGALALRIGQGSIKSRGVAQVMNSGKADAQEQYSCSCSYLDIFNLQSSH